jgi:hypothetical protein
VKEIFSWLFRDRRTFCDFFKSRVYESTAMWSKMYKIARRLNLKND